MTTPTPDELLADIAAFDPTAAALAAEVLKRRRASGGDVDDWTTTLERAKLSLLSSFAKTRLAFVARDELGIPHPVED